MLPGKQHKKTFSIPALGFIIASLLLGALLAFVTWHNMGREERLMESFLLQEGQTLIRAFEAGARTSMMRESRNGNLPTLVEETAREETIAYIVIRDENGNLIAGAGNIPSRTGFPGEEAVLTAEEPLTRSTHDSAGALVFEIAREFSPLATTQRRPGMMRRWQRWCGVSGDGDTEACRQVIYLGLYTRAFDAAREEDLKQSLILFGILFLVASGGLYALFLSQRNQVTRAALDNMKLYTANVISSLPAGLVTLDTDRRIVSANPKAIELFNCPEKEMQGKTFQQLTGPKECSLAPLLRENKEFIDQPTECLRHDGKLLPLKVSASRLHDRDGSLRGMVLILRDQREMRAMEERLERSRRHAALGRMAAGIAHEIRNPLGTLRGFAQYFSRSAKSDPKAEEYSEMMVEEVDRLDRTVSALLQFARPREPEWKDVDMGELLKRSAAFLKPDIENRQVEFHLDLPEEPIRTSADPDLLMQVLLNLLQNSLAAVSENDLIELGLKEKEEHIRIRVRDTGKGMTSEERAQMFDPFFTTRKDGTGLGLAVVQQIVEQHNGRIEVESEKGRGTCIDLILPQNGGQHAGA
ncbi:MAG: ATP-binding protein [Desulfuromonadales bacterium]